MSRSNYDKPFYVDVGTSIVAVRCASNNDVVLRYDHVWHPHTLKLAKDVCDRMNKEVENRKPLRNCDVGTEHEQADRLAEFCRHHQKGCGLRYGSKGIGHPKVTCPAFKDIECSIVWEQMLYESEVK